MTRQVSLLFGAIIMIIGSATGPASANKFRYAFQADVATLDPHALNEVFTLGFLGNFYEGLVRRRPDLMPEPALAERWENLEPTRWRFYLRQGVVFHDGDTFDADDVIFSFERARAETSNVKQRLKGVLEIKKVDDHTVDVITEVPMPTLVSQWDAWYIVSEQWAKQHGSENPVDFRSGEQSHATEHINGTGPFRLESRAVDSKTVAAANEDWWDRPGHNLSTIEFTPIANDATRVAALLSGEVDMIYPLPVQDMTRVSDQPGFTALTIPELRTIFLGMNHGEGSPFADPRVRQALYLAIDIAAIRDVVMRGMSVPTGEMVAPEVAGAEPERFSRPATDLDKARMLLTEARLPDGFRLQMDCPNDRYVNDEEICEAIVQMAAKVGIELDLFAQPRSRYFPKVLAKDTQLYLLGWIPATLDSWNVIHNLHTCGANFNLGSYCNPEVDELSEQIRQELGEAERMALVGEAWQMIYDDIVHIPLHQQMLAWAFRSKVDVVPTADNVLYWRHINVGSE